MEEATTRSRKPITNQKVIEPIIEPRVLCCLLGETTVKISRSWALNISKRNQCLIFVSFFGVHTVLCCIFFYYCSYLNHINSPVICCIMLRHFDFCKSANGWHIWLHQLTFGILTQRCFSLHIFCSKKFFATSISGKHFLLQKKIKSYVFKHIFLYWALILNKRKDFTIIGHQRI